MLCRRCNGTSEPEHPRTRLTEPRLRLGMHPRDGRRGDRRSAGGGQCSGCGGSLDADPLTERILEKQSQLARFGLADREEPILKAQKPKE
jgi:hypothetical protein